MTDKPSSEKASKTPLPIHPVIKSPKKSKNNSGKKNSSPKKISAKKAPVHTLNRSVINVIRTTQRNNIDLKHIADNKANILMSINALMITFLFPIVLSNMELIMDTGFYIPLSLLSITCVITVILSASVLRPFSHRGKIMREMTKFREKSPFFFENYDKMNVEDYYNYFCDVSNDEETFFKYVIEDLHYYGKILSLKYEQIKHAYTGFIIGVVLTALSTLAIFFIF